MTHWFAEPNVKDLPILNSHVESLLIYLSHGVVK